MNQDILSLVQQSFADFFESTNHFQELFAQEVANATDPAKKVALGEYIGLMRTTQAELQQVYPGEVEGMVQGLKDAEKSFAALEQKKEQPFLRLGKSAIKIQGRHPASRSHQGRTGQNPKTAQPGRSGRQRLAAMARRHGAENQTAHSPLLQDGPPVAKPSYWVSSNPNPMFEPPGPKQSAKSDRTGRRFPPMPRNQMTDSEP